MTAATSHPISLLLKRALCLRCPNCGQGKMFQSYLKVVTTCSACQEPLGRIRADDGPAWLTILIVGHIVVPLLMTVESSTDWPDWIVMPASLLVTVVLALGILPYSKAVFVAMIWHSRNPDVAKKPAPLA